MSKIINYHCTNCGRDFEAEEREIVECPQCYWSSSVKPADAAEPQKSAIHVPDALKPKRKAIPFGKIFALLLIGAILIALFFALPGFIKKFESIFKTDAKKPGVQISLSEELNDPDVSAAPAADLMSNKILTTGMDTAQLGTPSPAQQEILSREVPLQTGIVERLPSQVWDYALFEQTLENQIAHYKVPLPRSYRKKLQSHFELTYQAGAEAFLAGRLPEARDAWVRSLAYPLYSQDLQKHRGVALTLLRPFTEDVLSKIGAVNTMLVDRGFRGEEQVIQQTYHELLSDIQSRNWQQAIDKADAIVQRINAFQNQNMTKAAAPPYPREITGIDSGIAVTLMDLLKPSQASIADLTLVEQDVLLKKEIMQELRPSVIDAQVKLYNEAMEFIAQGEWNNAAAKLEQISSPKTLKEDAQKKLNILRQNKNQSLDSI